MAGDAVQSSETSVNLYETARHYISDYNIVYSV
jgi:hypothetical protein